MNREQYFHHPAPPGAPLLSHLTFKEHSMSITGVILPTIDLTITLPTTRKDGGPLKSSEIQSATLLRDSGQGPVAISTLNGPFSGETVTFSDVSPSTAADTYSFFVTDTAGTQGPMSLAVAVTVTGKAAVAPPAAGTLTAVAKPPHSEAA